MSGTIEISRSEVERLYCENRDLRGSNIALRAGAEIQRGLADRYREERKQLCDQLGVQKPTAVLCWRDGRRTLTEAIVANCRSFAEAFSPYPYEQYVKQLTTIDPGDLSRIPEYPAPGYGASDYFVRTHQFRLARAWNNGRLPEYEEV